MFRQLAQTDGGPVDKFVVRLRQQAWHCDSLDDNLRDHLIEKLTDLELKRKLLEIGNITSAHVLENARALEVADQQVKHMASGSGVNAVRKKKERPKEQPKKTCFNCEKTGHLSSKK